MNFELLVDDIIKNINIENESQLTEYLNNDKNIQNLQSTIIEKMNTITKEPSFNESIFIKNLMMEFMKCNTDPEIIKYNNERLKDLYSNNRELYDKFFNNIIDNLNNNTNNNKFMNYIKEHYDTSLEFREKYNEYMYKNHNTHIYKKMIRYKYLKELKEQKEQKDLSGASLNNKDTSSNTIFNKTIKELNNNKLFIDNIVNKTIKDISNETISINKIDIDIKDLDILDNLIVDEKFELENKILEELITTINKLDKSKKDILLSKIEKYVESNKDSSFFKELFKDIDV